MSAARNETAEQRHDHARRERLVALIQSWREAEKAEQEDQCETWAYLQRALNENRTSERRRRA